MGRLDHGLEFIEWWDVGHSHTVDVHLMLLHEFPETGEPFRCVYRLHVLVCEFIKNCLRAGRSLVQRTCACASGGT